MLRITTETERFESTLRLEGRLAGPWVDELARTWDHKENTMSDTVIHRNR